MLGSFLIFLREGIEGSMIISIMCAYLAAAGRRDLFRWVFAGVGVALGASAIAGVGMYIVVKDAFIDSTVQIWFETCTFLLAVVVLTYMTFWMKRNARLINSRLKEQINAAVTGGSAFALALLAFATVGREAVETVIFLLAIAFQNSPVMLLIGAVAGVTISLSASVGIYRLGKRMNLKRFFTIVGAALTVVAAGLLANAIQNLQELKVLPGAGQALWHTGRFIADKSTLGDTLHGLLGYSAAPSFLQVATYALFLCIALVAFLGLPSGILSRSGGSSRGKLTA